MTEQRIRVLVADDHVVVREGIRHVLAGAPDFDVVAEAGDGDETLALVERFVPDVVVLDITMPGKTGLEVTAELRKRFPEVRILILSMHEHSEYVMEAVRLGAHGYVLKDSGPAELRAAVRAVHEGAGFFSPGIAKRLTAALQGDGPPPGPRASLEALTARERDVLLGVAAGRTNKQIAAELGISHRTVETHRESLMRKLELRSIAELTRFALEAGLLGPSSGGPSGGGGS